MSDTATTPKTFNIQIGGFEEEFVLVKTNCPQAYDYGYCIAVYGGHRDERFVLVPSGRLDYQMGRYQSGGFAAIEEASESIKEWITERLYARIRAL